MEKSKPNEAPTGLPIVEALGLVKLPKGWSVVLIRTQGERVIEKEVLRGPEPKAVALEALRLAFVRRFLSGGAS